MSGTYPQAVFLKVDIDQFEVYSCGHVTSDNVLRIHRLRSASTQALSEREDIQTIPTFQVYSDGKKQSHIVGSEHIAQVGAKVKELLG